MVQWKEQIDWLCWARKAKETGDSREKEKGRLEASHLDGVAKSTDWGGTQSQNGVLFEKRGTEQNARRSLFNETLIAHFFSVGVFVLSFFIPLHQMCVKVNI